MATGDFVWRELYSQNPKQVQGFYAELMGWDLRDVPMGSQSYPMLHLRNVPIAALLGPGPEGLLGWVSYVSVASVDDVAQKTKDLGGKVRFEPTDIEGGGRYAILEDFGGAVFGVHHSAKPMDNPHNMPRPGELCWETLTTQDIKRAVDFYGQVLGWQTVASPTGNEQELVFATADGSPIADVQLARTLPSAWSTYVAVASLGGVLGRAQRMGGRIPVPRVEIPNVGFMAMMNDPLGTPLGLFEPMM